MRGQAFLSALFLLCSLLSVGCGPKYNLPDERTDALVRITVLHTNDIHGQILPQKGFWVDPANPPLIGGLLSVATYIHKVREEVSRNGGHLLVLDSGDLYQGTPEGTLTKGDVVVDIMNSIGYDAVALGNHEFDHGIDNARRLAKRANFPFLAANCRETASGRAPPFLQSHLLREIAGIRLAIIGLTTSDMENVVGPGLTRGLEFLPEKEGVLSAAEEFRPTQQDFVLLISHSGIEKEQELAGLFPRIPLILGGHSHTGLPGGWRHPDTGVWYFQTFGKASAINRVDLVFSARSHKLLELSGELVGLNCEDYPPDENAQKIFTPYREDIGRIMDVRVGKSTIPLTRNRGFLSSPVGNWVTDRMRTRTGANIALTNKTGLRTDIPAGEIFRRNLFELSPFGNTLVTMELTGTQIRQGLEYNLSQDKFVLEVSGMSYTHDERRPVGNRLIEAWVDGQPLVDSRIYRVVTNDFLASGGDGHIMFTRGRNRTKTGIVLRELEEESLRTNPPDRSIEENRIRSIAPAPTPPDPDNTPTVKARGIGVASPVSPAGMRWMETEADRALSEWMRRHKVTTRRIEVHAQDERIDTLRILASRNDLGIVVALGPGYRKALLHVAPDYSEVLFLWVDASAPNPSLPPLATNVITLPMDRRAPGYLAALLAARRSPDQPLLFLAGGKLPSSIEYETGIQAGARTANLSRVRIEHLDQGASGYQDWKAARNRLSKLAPDNQAAMILHLGSEPPSRSSNEILLGYNVRIDLYHALLNVWTELCRNRKTVGQNLPILSRVAYDLGEELPSSLRQELDATIQKLNEGSIEYR